MRMKRFSKGLMVMKNEKTFQNRIFRTLLFSTLGILAVFIISLVNFYLFLSQHYISYCENVLTQVSSQIENVLHKMTLSQKQTYLTVCESPIHKSSYYDEQVMLSGREIISSLANICYTNDDIDNIFVHMYRNDGFYTTEKSAYDRKDIQRRIADNQKNIGDMNYDVTMEHDGEIETVNFYSYSYEMGTSKIVSGLCVSLKYNRLSKILGSIDLHESQQVYLVARNGNILYNSGNSENLESADLYNQQTSIDIFDNKSVISHKVDSIDWKLIVVVNHLSLFFSLFKNSFLFLGISYVICVLVSIGFAFSRSKALASPINEIIEQIQGYSEHNKKLLEIKTNNTDIASLVENYNRLIRRIENLHEINISNEKEKMRVEYKALLSQINPHFLFNSLDCMRGMALKYKARDLSLTIRSLSLMLQYSLVEANEKVTLRDELENLENYMSIVTNQSNSSLQCSFDIAPDVYDMPVIKFMLQPIVENSVKFRSKGTNNSIRISAFRKEQGLQIVVRDNGTGLTKEYADKINSILLQNGDLRESISVSGTGIGLSNISKRLRYSFGSKSYVRIEPDENIGAVVTINIDYSTDKVENH